MDGARLWVRRRARLRRRPLLRSRAPVLLESLAFALRFRNRQLRILLAHDEERYELEEGDPLQVSIRGVPHVLARDTPLVLRRTAQSEEETRVMSALQLEGVESERA
jgi:hypothetical protein